MPRWNQVAATGTYVPIKHPEGKPAPYQRGDILKFANIHGDERRMVVQAIEWDLDDEDWSMLCTTESETLFDEVECAKKYWNDNGLSREVPAVEYYYESTARDSEFELVGHVKPITVPELKSAADADRFLTELGQDRE